MANVKISELTALTPPDAADLVPVTDSSASQTKRTTIGEIVGIINGDVDVANDGTATISELPVSKLQDGAARQLLQTDAAGTGVEWTSNVDVPGTLDVTGATTLDSTLGVTGQSTLASAAVSDLTSGRVVLAGTSGELEDSAGLTFNGTQLDVNGNVVITGDLTVEGASTILETETVKVEDKNIELGVVASPTDVTADGGGITLKGTTDKTINWVDATDSWTSSEHVNLASGKSYRIDGTEVLSGTTLGSGVTGSSLTSVGTLGSLTVTGSATAGSFTPTSNTVPTNGLYLLGTNQVGLSTDSVGRFFVDSAGNFKASTNETYATGGYHQFNQNAGSQWTLGVLGRNATDPYGIRVEYTDAAPNGTVSQFLYCVDTAGVKAEIRSNGGLANYSANNANLSDRNAKKDISPAADTWDCIKEWEIVNYRYKDQPDDADLNLGVIAQQVAESCPEVITVFEEAKDDQPEKLGVKEQQMYWMAIKALQEAQVRIEQLEAKVAALESA